MWIIQVEHRLLPGVLLVPGVHEGPFTEIGKTEGGWGLGRESNIFVLELVNLRCSLFREMSGRQC